MPTDRPRPDLPLLPRRMARLPVSPAGYPVPWFVAWIDGAPDFRVIGHGKIEQAVRERRCWVCGSEFTTQYAAFVIGPMCAVNRTSAEPPSHRDCAIFSATACPFLVRPEMKRGSELRQVAGAVEPEGIYLKRNPGVALVWITRDWRPEPIGRGVLFKFGEPTETHWYCQGREATRAEVLASIESGVPLLREVAEAQDREEPGARAVEQLMAMVEQAQRFLPVT